MINTRILRQEIRTLNKHLGFCSGRKIRHEINKAIVQKRQELRNLVIK